MRQSYVGPLVLTVLILCGICGYFLFSRMTTVELPNDVRKAAETMNNNALTFAEARQKLRNVTDILGETAYGSDGTILGTMYDAYANVENGEIDWISINVEGNPSAPLVKLSASTVRTFNEPIVIDLTKEAFMEYPVQKDYDKELLGYVSIRGLPDAKMVDGQGRDIGDVVSVEYEGRIVTDILFTVSAPIFEYEADQVFSIPFEYLKFANVDDFYIEGVDIALTERQTGALKAYAKVIEDQR